MPGDPSTSEWVVAAVAAVLVVAVGAAHLVRPVLAGSRATPWARVAGVLLAMLATGFVLCTAVTVVAWVRAGDAGAADATFASVLLPDEEVAGAVAGYAVAVGLPLAAVVGVLALAVIGVGASFRGVAAGVAVVVWTGSLLAVRGDVGAAAGGAAWAALAMSIGACVALAVDGYRARQSSRSPASSDSSTTSSQRSLQSLQR